MCRPTDKNYKVFQFFLIHKIYIIMFLILIHLTVENTICIQIIKI